jgi:hypothetical protein
LLVNLDVFSDSESSPHITRRLIDENVDILTDLLMDPMFSTILKNAYGIRLNPDVEIRAVFEDEEALDTFMEKEKELLVHSGLDNDEYVELVLGEARRVVRHGIDGLVPPHEVFESLTRLKFALIELREGQVHERDWKPAVRTWATGLGGGALVLLNASGWALSLGLSAPLSALSSALGGTILGKSIERALERPSQSSVVPSLGVDPRDRDAGGSHRRRGRPGRKAG